MIKILFVNFNLVYHNLIDINNVLGVNASGKGNKILERNFVKSHLNDRLDNYSASAII